MAAGGQILLAGDRRTKACTKPLHEGAEVCTIRVRKTGPQPEKTVQMQFSMQVFLGDRTAIVVWLDNARAWIGALLSEFSERPSTAVQ